MLGRILRLLRGPAVTVPGTDRLAEGEGRTVDVGDPLADGKQVLLCRVGGKVYALDTLCPHEGGRIQPGPLADGKYAFCPLHNYRFDPRTGAAVGAACRPARRCKVEERGNDSLLWP